MSAELQKMKRTFSIKLLWIAPLMPLLCAFSGGQFSAFYFWYAAFLPGALTIICSMVMLKDTKMKYRGVFSLPVDKSATWMGKVMACGVMVLITCIIFLLVLSVFGFIPIYKIYNLSVIQMLTASVLLFIALLWQIPFCLFLSAKFGIFLTIILNIAGNIIGGAAFAGGKMWLFPYAIPTRLMGPVLHILPNGLKPETGSPILNSGVILPGVLISLALFVAISMLTMAWFRRQEAK